MADLQYYLDKILGVADVRSIAPSGNEVYDPASRSARRYKFEGSMATRSTLAGHGKSIDIHVPLLSKRSTLTKQPNKRHMTSEVNLSSRFSPYGMHGRDDHVAEIFFRTGSANAQAGVDVMIQVAALVGMRLFGGIKTQLRFEGLADVRGTQDDNARLSRRRSAAVKRFVDAKVQEFVQGMNGDFGLYSSALMSYGESISHKRPSAFLQATDRVVDILMDPPIKRPADVPMPEPNEVTPAQRQRVAELLRKRFGLTGDLAGVIAKGGNALTVISALAGLPALSLAGAVLGPLFALNKLISDNAELVRAPTLLSMAYSVVAFAFNDELPPKLSQKLSKWLKVAGMGPGTSQHQRVVKAWNRFGKLTVEKLRRDELWSLEKPETYKAALRIIGGEKRQQAFRRYHEYLVRQYLGDSGDSATYHAAMAHNREFVYPD